MIESSRLTRCVDKILKGEYLDREEAFSLLEVDLYEMLFAANRVRRYFKGDKINFCSIINARSGNCSQDCKFCAQSAHNKTGVQAYPLVSAGQVGQGAQGAVKAQACHYGIVVSGRGAGNKDEIEEICRLIKAVPQDKIGVCGSLGELSREFAAKLKEAGLTRYHHNLETSEKFFPRVCTTHTYADKIKTLRIAQDTGFEVCSGGIFGLGEGWEDRIDMAFALRELGVSSVPLNFLVPVAGTPFEHNKPLPPLEILRIIAIYRLILPDKDIKVAGGREINLRDLQSWIFYAGANGALIGNYLTTAGRSAEDDLRMTADLQLTANTE